MMNYHVITLFLDSFSSYLNESILKRAIEDKKIKVYFYDPKNFSIDNKRVDDKPYGGGPGMVVEALPVFSAFKNCSKKIKDKKKAKVIWFTPSGKIFDNTMAKNIALRFTDIIFICGRYEGIDERAKKMIKDSGFKIDEISVGPFVLTGGELPAMIAIDSISRQVKGVLGSFDSLEEKRIASSKVYTRPETIVYSGKKYKVPKVLLSGKIGRAHV